MPTAPDETDSDFTGDDDESFSEMLISLANDWLQTQLTHHVSLEATNAFWRLSLKSFHKLIERKTAEGIKRKIPQFVQIRRNIYKDICPDVKMTFVFLNKNDNTIVNVNTNQTPLTDYQRDPQYVKLYEKAHIEVTLFTILAS